MNEERKIVSIPINKIIPNIYQPRIIFDGKSLNELSNSIKRYGIIQPLVLRHLEDKYEIVDGERRYKAAKRIGLETVPAIVLEINDKELETIARMSSGDLRYAYNLLEVAYYSTNDFNITKETPCSFNLEKSTSSCHLEISNPTKVSVRLYFW